MNFALALLTLAVFAQSPDVKPMDQVNATAFSYLVEGLDKMTFAATKGSYESYIGGQAEMGYCRAKLGEKQYLEWVTAVPAEELLKHTVTFVVPMALGGNGGKIQGVPFEISVNGKPAITIHSSVEATTFWQKGQVHALFAKVHEDQFGDPSGLLLLAVPGSMLEAGKGATIRVEGRPTEQLQDSFVMVHAVHDNVKFVEQVGGLAALLSGKTAPTSGDKVAGPRKATYDAPPLVKLDGRQDASVCLTGNATGELAPRNKPVEQGRYTYYDGGTDSFYFPHYNPFAPGDANSREGNYHENWQTGGWINFKEGKLTDGSTKTKIGYPIYLQTASGIDIVFDLGAEYLLDELVTYTYEPDCRNVQAMVRSSDDKRWVTIQAFADRATVTDGHYPKMRKSPQTLPLGGAASRYVRVNACWEAQWCGFSEVQVWGRPVSGEKPALVALRQARGEVKAAQPVEKPLTLPSPAIIPQPQVFEAGQDVFELNKTTVVAIPAGASDRTRRTAEVLAQDLKDEMGLSGKLVELEKGRAAPRGAIVVSGVGAAGDSQLKDARAEGYALTVAPDRIEVRGRDDVGLYYGSQAIIQLARADAKGNFTVPACTVRDWPDKPFRSFCAAETVTAGFIKAISRARINQYSIGANEQVTQALELNQTAEDRFVEFAPMITYGNAIYLRNPEELAEKNPGEKYKDLHEGRINVCPSHPDTWKIYGEQLDRAAKIHGTYVNVNMDEMYIPEMGSRWNVCVRCRARKMNGHELMADTIAKVFAELQKRGKKMMIIDSPFYTGGLSYPEDKDNDWRKSADLLAKMVPPQDVVIYVWHGIPLAERLRALGFRTIFWSAGPGSDLPDVFEGHYAGLGDSSFRPSYLLAMSQGLWSPKRLPAATDANTALIEQQMPLFNRLWTGHVQPSRRAGAQFTQVDLRGVANDTYIDEQPYDGRGVADLGPNYDLRALTPGRRTFNGVPFDVIDPQGGKAASAVVVHNRFFYNKSLPSQVEIPVGRKAGSICFLHTMDHRLGQAYWYKRELVGYYHMVYEDGTYEPMELKYAINICNFDGLPAYWDYAPRGYSMARATLGWRGQMGGGQTAYLYTAEWINPFPNKMISRIIMAATHKPGDANPVLLAATVVTATEQDAINPPAPSRPFGQRDASRITPPVPKGRKIDLTHGKVEDNNRVWKTDDGITLELDAPARNPKTMEIIQPPINSPENMVWENNMGAHTTSYYSTTTTVTLPKPRPLTGLRVNSGYRGEGGSAVDHGMQIANYVIITADGQGIRQIEKRDLHIGEEEGPLWIALDGKPVTSVKIFQNQRLEGTVANTMGIELLELYEETAK